MKRWMTLGFFLLAVACVAQTNYPLVSRDATSTKLRAWDSASYGKAHVMIDGSYTTFTLMNNMGLRYVYGPGYSTGDLLYIENGDGDVGVASPSALGITANEPLNQIVYGTGSGITSSPDFIVIPNGGVIFRGTAAGSAILAGDETGGNSRYYGGFRTYQGGLSLLVTDDAAGNYAAVESVFTADNTGHIRVGPGSTSASYYIVLTSNTLVANDLTVANDLFVNNDATISGKLTVTGLIDPTGLELTPQVANPGGTAANTMWLDSGDGDRLKIGSNKLAYLSEASGVSDGDKGDISVSGGGATWDIDAGAVGNAEFRDSAALSVVGRSANSIGDVADISATGGSNYVLMEDGNTVAFGQVETNGIANNAVTLSKLQTITSGYVLGYGNGGTGNVTQMLLDTTKFYVNGTNISIEDNAIDYAEMQNVSAGSKLLGRGDSGSGDPQEITLGTNLSMSGTTLNAASGGADGLGADGDVGDATVGGTGTTLTIDNDAVTYAKIQNVSAASKLLGRGDSGAGDTQEITLGTNLSMSGTTLNAASGADGLGTDGDKGDITVGGTGTTLEIDASAVGSSEIADASVALGDIVNASANSKLLGSGASGSGSPYAELTLGTNLSMSGTTLNAASTADGLGSDGDKGDVTVGGSGTTLTVDNNAITYAKIQDVSATQRVLGRNSGGSGDAEEVTLSQLLDWVGSAAQGDILYRNASGWTRLGAGTSGQVLVTAGTGANPAWGSAGAAGDPGGWTWVVSSADEDVTNNTLADHTELQFSVVAGGRYAVHGELIMAGDDDAIDGRFNFVVSAGTMYGYGRVEYVNAAMGSNVTALSVSSGTKWTNDINTGVGGNTDSFDGLSYNTFDYSFTQQTSNATAKIQFATWSASVTKQCRIVKGSVLRYKRLD